MQLICIVRYQPGALVGSGGGATEGGGGNVGRGLGGGGCVSGCEGIGESSSISTRR